MTNLLIGDSHSVRFHKFLRTQGLSRFHVFAAQGGISIDEGRQLILSSKYEGEEVNSVFLSLGSNNILKGIYDPEISHKQYRSVVRLIKHKLNPRQIFIFKVPIFPRVSNNQDLIDKIHKYNAFLSTFNSNTIRTLNVPGITNTITIDFFQAKFFNGRTDLIHLNNVGYTKVAQCMGLIGQ